MITNFKIGDQVLMPEPNATDAWVFGNFVARITDETPDGKCWIVEDQDSDFWTVEKERVTDPNEDAAEEQRRDEKRGLYPQHEDVAN